MAKRKPRPYFTYRGVTVWRNDSPGWTGARLRYSALGGFAADTQAGIKALIREADSNA